MSSLLGSILNSLLGGGEVHDYGHAAQVFRTNNFARSPKYKFLFQVNFILDTNAPSQIDPAELSYLVKSIDLPKFTVELKDLNQYNRKTFIQSRIKYEPITIKFHDDNTNGLRELWQNYYNYYYADGIYSLNDYVYDDRYGRQQDRRHSEWGLDNGAISPFFSAIEIYSMAGGQSNKITLMNPIISSFSHDTHEYSESTGVMEATMQIHYMGVTYEDGYAMGVPGIGDPQYYDNNPSAISGNSLGYYVDPVTGDLVRQTDNFTNPYQVNQQQQHGSFGFVDQSNNYDPTSYNSLTDQELQSIGDNNNQQDTSTLNAVFPVANSISPNYSNNPYDYTTNSGAFATSNGINIPTPQQYDSLYPAGSYQAILFSRGYTIPQITSASQFVDALPANTPTSYTKNTMGLVSAQALIAQQYIDDPATVSNLGAVDFGQPVGIPSQLDFTNPASPVNPVYNSQTWQTTLASEGYSNSDITLAATQIAQLNVVPGTDLASIARSYIAYSKNNNGRRSIGAGLPL